MVQSSTTQLKKKNKLAIEMAVPSKRIQLCTYGWFKRKLIISKNLWGVYLFFTCTLCQNNGCKDILSIFFKRKNFVTILNLKFRLFLIFEEFNYQPKKMMYNTILLFPLIFNPRVLSNKPNYPQPVLMKLFRLIKGWHNNQERHLNKIYH